MSRSLAIGSISLLLLVIPFITSAQTTADVIAQLQAQIQALLQQISTLQTQAGQNPSSGGGASVGNAGSCYSFTRTLSPDPEASQPNGEVTQLQQFLAAQGASIYPEARITGYFGPATERAVQRFQTREGIVSSGDPDSTGFGALGPRTRAVIARLCGGSPAVPPTTPTPTPIPALPNTFPGVTLNVSPYVGTVDTFVANISVGNWTDYTYEIAWGEGDGSVQTKRSRVITVCNNSWNCSAPAGQLHQYGTTGEFPIVLYAVKNGVRTPAARAIARVSSLTPSTQQSDAFTVSVQETDTTNNVIHYTLNVPARYAGHYVVFILNPVSVSPSISSGSLITTQIGSDWKGGQLTGSVGVQHAHEGFATNQGGVRWFATSPGTYKLTAVVYAQSPFKLGTEMEYWSVEEQRARGIVASEIANSNVFRITKPNTTVAPSCAVRADRTSVRIGETFTITWSSSNATSIAAKGAASNELNGSVTLATNDWKTGVYEYPITVTGPGGTGKCSISIPIVSQLSETFSAPVINYFSGPQLIKSGEAVGLNWSASGPAGGGCYLFAGPLTTNNYSLITGSQASYSGSLTISPKAKTTYTLKCYSSWKDGTPTAEKSVTVDVLSEGVTVDIKAAGADSWGSLAPVGAGTAVLLTWTSSNANTCDIENSSGDIVGNTPTGSKSVTLSQTTTFTIECVGSLGVLVRDSVTVAVSSANTGAVAMGVYEGTYPPGVSHSFGNHPEGKVNVTVSGESSYNRHLVLFSYEPVEWVFNNPNGIKIDKVILLGYHNQRATGLSSDTIVEHYSYDSNGTYLGVPYSGNADATFKSWMNARYGNNWFFKIGAYKGDAMSIYIGQKG